MSALQVSKGHERIHEARVIFTATVPTTRAATSQKASGHQIDGCPLYLHWMACPAGRAGFVYRPFINSRQKRNIRQWFWFFLAREAKEKQAERVCPTGGQCLRGPTWGQVEVPWVGLHRAQGSEGRGDWSENRGQSLPLPHKQDPFSGICMHSSVLLLYMSLPSLT